MDEGILHLLVILPLLPHICIYHQAFWRDSVPGPCLGDRARLSLSLSLADAWGYGKSRWDRQRETVSAVYAGRAKVGLDLSMHDSRFTRYSGYGGILMKPNVMHILILISVRTVQFCHISPFLSFLSCFLILIHASLSTERRIRGCDITWFSYS